MPNQSFYKTNSRTILLIQGRISEIHTFPKGIRPKVNVKAKLEFDFAHFDSSRTHSVTVIGVGSLNF